MEASDGKGSREGGTAKSVTNDEQGNEIRELWTAPVHCRASEPISRLALELQSEAVGRHLPKSRAWMPKFGDFFLTKASFSKRSKLDNWLWDGGRTCHLNQPTVSGEKLDEKSECMCLNRLGKPWAQGRLSSDGTISASLSCLLTP